MTLLVSSFCCWGTRFAVWAGRCLGWTLGFSSCFGRWGRCSFFWVSLFLFGFRLLSFRWCFLCLWWFFRVAPFFFCIDEFSFVVAQCVDFLLQFTSFFVEGLCEIFEGLCLFFSASEERLSLVSLSLFSFWRMVCLSISISCSELLCGSCWFRWARSGGFHFLLWVRLRCLWVCFHSLRWVSGGLHIIVKNEKLIYIMNVKYVIFI